MKIGILNIQGAIDEHYQVCLRNEVEAVLVNNAGDLEDLDGLILPGGESTVMRKLIDNNLEFKKALYKFVMSKPVYATCAGSILLSNEYFGVLDINVTRNGFGSQIQSEVTNIKWKDIVQPVAFIRAPIFNKVNDHKFEIEVYHRNQLVGIESNNIIALSFHPELTKTDLLFNYFLEKLK